MARLKHYGHIMETDNTKQIISELSTAVVDAHWKILERLLTADDSKSARINAILRVNDNMLAAVKAAQDAETSFTEDHLSGFFKD